MVVVGGGEMREKKKGEAVGGAVEASMWAIGYRISFGRSRFRPRVGCRGLSSLARAEWGDWRALAGETRAGGTACETLASFVVR